VDSLTSDASSPAARAPGELLVLLWREWRTIALTAVVTCVVAIAAFFVLPDDYVSNTVLVPSSETQSRASLALGQLPGGLGGLLGGGGSPGDRLLGAVLKSRTIGDTITRRLVREGFREADVRRVLAKGTRTQRAVDGSVNIQVRAREPRLAARVAGTYGEAANAILARVGRESAQRRRRFIAEQLGTAREQLVESEQRVLEFQQRRSTPDLPEQARRTIDAASQLQREIFAQELEVARLRRLATPGNPELQAAEQRLGAQRAQLRELTANGGGSGQLFVPLREGAALKLAALRLQREFTAEERIFESLTAAAAEAQFATNENTPAVTVLDAAFLPTAPTRSYLPLLLAPLLGAVFGVALVLARDAARRIPWTSDAPAPAGARPGPAPVAGDAASVARA
jgi:uncharacterized protein involved in exopolysaccharide biosynthesis